MAKETKKSFILYCSQRTAFEMLSGDDCKTLILSIFDYAKSSNEQKSELQKSSNEHQMNPSVQMAFAFISQTLDRDKAKYEQKCIKNAENIKSRWDETKKSTTNHDRLQEGAICNGIPKLQTNTKDTTVYDCIPTDTKHTDNDNDSDNDIIPPIFPKGEVSTLFETFWKAYPKKQGKQNAVKAFGKLKVDSQLFDEIMSGLNAQVVSEQWRKDNGQFIPLPASWLRGRRWEDELIVGLSENDPYADVMNLFEGSTAI